MVDAVASDYQGEITFVAVAGRSNLEQSRRRVGDWFDPTRILWGYDDELWARYGVGYQPVSFFISSDDVVIQQAFGALGEEALRAELDRLAAVG